jgi:hypothetical protein
MKQVHDLALASYLAAIGHKFSIKPEGNRTIFLFEGSENLETHILNFYNRMGKVDALTFSETLRSLKALVLRSQ